MGLSFRFSLLCMIHSEKHRQESDSDFCMFVAKLRLAGFGFQSGWGFPARVGFFSQGGVFQPGWGFLGITGGLPVRFLLNGKKKSD